MCYNRHFDGQTAKLNLAMESELLLAQLIRLLSSSHSHGGYCYKVQCSEHGLISHLFEFDFGD
jgi:hypothetical protein